MGVTAVVEARHLKNTLKKTMKNVLSGQRRWQVPKQHKVDWGPGYRFFRCEECGRTWKSKSRDCTSPSVESCPSGECMYGVVPCWFEKHYDWPTDGSGNLLEESDYEEWDGNAKDLK